MTRSTGCLSRKLDRKEPPHFIHLVPWVRVVGGRPALIVPATPCRFEQRIREGPVDIRVGQSVLFNLSTEHTPRRDGTVGWSAWARVKDQRAPHQTRSRADIRRMVVMTRCRMTPVQSEGR
jgi:hypothetical protein